MITRTTGTSTRAPLRAQQPIGAQSAAPQTLRRATACLLGAWDADVNLDLGRLYLRAGNLVRARERWEEVARVGDESNAEVAQRLLQAKAVSDESGPESR